MPLAPHRLGRHKCGQPPELRYKSLWLGILPGIKVSRWASVDNSRQK